VFSQPRQHDQLKGVLAVQAFEADLAGLDLPLFSFSGWLQGPELRRGAEALGDVSEASCRRLALGA